MEKDIAGKLTLMLILLLMVQACSDENFQRYESQSRSQADELLEHIHDADAMKYFDNKYFPQEDLDYIARTLQDFHKHCDTVGRAGQLVNTAYNKKIGGASHIVYTYDYSYNCQTVRYSLTYNFEEDTFLLSHFQILPAKSPASR